MAKIKAILLGAGVLGFIAINTASIGATSASISHSYHTTTMLPQGSMVSIVNNKSNYVEPSNIGNSDRLLGITVPKTESLIAIDTTNSTVQVATSGTVSVLASNVNGNISVGDKISASPFDGVGMKASAGQDVIGLAQSSFNPQTAGAQRESIKGKNGRTSQVLVGYINLTIAPGVDEASASLSGLEKFAQSLTGHKVSAARIVISIVIAIAAILSLVTLVYASIYGGIVAIGRNPLARFAIFRALGSVVWMTLLIALVGGLTIYLLLS